MPLVPKNNLLTVLAFRRQEPCPDTQTNCNNNHTEHFSFTLLDYLTEVLHISNQTNCLLQFNYCQHLSFTLLYFSRAITHFFFCSSRFCCLNKQTVFVFTHGSSNSVLITLLNNTNMKQTFLNDKFTMSLKRFLLLVITCQVHLYPLPSMHHTDM